MAALIPGHDADGVVPDGLALHAVALDVLKRVRAHAGLTAQLAPAPERRLRRQIASLMPARVGELGRAAAHDQVVPGVVQYISCDLDGVQKAREAADAADFHRLAVHDRGVEVHHAVPAGQAAAAHAVHRRVGLDALRHLDGRLNGGAALRQDLCAGGHVFLGKRPGAQDHPAIVHDAALRFRNARTLRARPRSASG
jgi:hypothetical protein